MAGKFSGSAPRRRPGAALLFLLLGAWACTAQNPAFVPPTVGSGEDAAAEADLPPSPDARPAPPPDLAPDEAPLAPDASPPLPPDAAVVPSDAAPDLPVDRGPPGSVLLVVGETSPLHKSDVQLRDSLIKHGFTVTLRDGTAATGGDASGRALVVLSGSSWSDDVGSKFRDVPVPVVCFDRALFSPMKLTGTRSGTDYGEIDYGKQLMITDDTHPLAGGLSGLVTFSTGDMMISWGVPSASAIRVATTTENAGRFTIFAYEAGALMLGMNAPARRVGSFVRYPRDASFSESGLLLFEAAALWAIGYR